MSTEEHSGHRGEGSKHLKGLPKIQASPDFEARLQRRITEEVKPTMSGASGRWIPVLAYSAATVVVLSIISYYAFFRSGVIPVLGPIVAQETLKNNEQLSDQASTSQNEPAQSIAKLEDRNPGKEKASDEKNDVVEKKESRGTGSIAVRAEKPQDYRNKSVIAGDRMKEEQNAARAGQELAKAPAAAMEESQAGMRSDMASVPSPQESAAAAPSLERRISAAAPKSTGVNLVAESESLVKAEVNQMQFQNFAKAPSVESHGDLISIERQLVLVTQQIDSLGVKDSIKLDSLRRVQKSLQIQRYNQMWQQKAKVRKPD